MDEMNRKQTEESLDFWGRITFAYKEYDGSFARISVSVSSFTDEKEQTVAYTL